MRKKVEKFGYWFGAAAMVAAIGTHNYMFFLFAGVGALIGMLAQTK